MSKISKRPKPVISLFVHCYPPANGGVEFLTKNIKALLDRKFEVHVFTGRGLSLDSYKTFSQFIPSESDPVIHRLDLNILSQRLANKLLNKIVFKIGFFSPFYFGPILKYSPQDLAIIQKSDLLFGLGLPTKMIYDAYRFSSLYQKKLLILTAYHNVSYYNNCYFFQKAFDQASGIVTLTPLEEKELLSNYKIRQDKIHQNTFCPYTTKQINHQNRLNLQAPRHFSQPVIGYIGQISPRKNLPMFKSLLDHNFRVIFAGARTASSPLVEKTFASYLASGQLKIIYNFPEADKRQIYSQIDFFVNPSIEESLGIVNFEAIFYGKILLAHRLSPFSGLLPAPRLNQVFSTPTQLLKIVNHLKQTPSVCSQIVYKQHRILTKYNLDQFSFQLINLINNLK
ncbi:MAG: glycosyltransferase family 4 protein [Candidatus Shapirobacteria bacterium]|jgi:glycosyltransferase involved in cell wall biosynthesis